MYTNVNKTVFNCNMAAEQSYIQKHVLIQQRTLKVDGTLLYQGKDAISTTVFFLELYRFMGINNPDLKLILDSFGINIPPKFYRRAELKQIKTSMEKIM